MAMLLVRKPLVDEPSVMSIFQTCEWPISAGQTGMVPLFRMQEGSLASQQI